MGGRGTWVVLALLVAAVALGRAGSARADTFTACGDRIEAGGTVDNCLSIGDAVAAAIANPGPDTIQLEGGMYCPIDFEQDTGPITFVGLPPVAPPGVSYSTGGVEAEHSAFEFDPPYCGDQTSGELVYVDNDPSPLVFENLAVIGGDGFYAQDANITLRNVVIEQSDTTGLYWQFVEGSIERSAIVDNAGNGAAITATNGVTIVNSTFAENTQSGLYMDDFFRSTLVNDSIVDNGLYGLTMSGSGTGQNGMTMVNTAISGNGPGEFKGADDCNNVLDTVSLGHNVYGSSCWEFQNDAGHATDYVYEATVSPAFGALDANGGSTWTEMLPTDETNAPHFVNAGDQSSCPAIDQRGFGRDDGQCDVGAVEFNADTTPNATLPESVDFGDVALGSTASQTITLTNRGGAALDVAGVAVSGAGFEVTTDTCAAESVDPGDTCIVGVTATPAGAGALSGSLAVTDNAADSPQSIALSANGFAPPAAGFSASSLDFGDVTDGTTATRSVTITNAGGGELDVELDGIGGADADLFQVGSGGCASLESGLGAGESCDVEVTFTPSAAGPASAVLSVYDSASGGENEVELSGVGVAAGSSSGGSSGGSSSGPGGGSGSSGGGSGSSGGSPHPAPGPPPAPAPPAFYSRPAPTGAAGTLAVGIGSGHPTVAWQPQSFTAPVTVTVAPQAGSGFAVGGDEVKLTVQAADGSAVTSFSAPLELTFPNAPAGTVPGYSADGTTWTAMPELASDSLPPGFRDGWYRDAAGTIHILTMHATYFGLLAAATPATSEFTVSLGYPHRLVLGRRSLVVALRSSLPGRAAVVLRRARHVTAKTSGAVTAGATSRIALALPHRTRAGGYRLTVVLIAGKERFTRVVGVRLAAPRSK